jgi:hypothetical protein
LVIEVQAQYYFGRNKIQYNRFEWNILRTKHFDIYFYPEMEDLAEIGAFFAEESYSLLQDRFNHNILNKIPMVFYSSHLHFEETNTLPYLIPQGLGGFFEFIKGRVVVPCDGSLFRFKMTIRHELVHVFMRSYIQRVLKDHRHVQFKEVPLWFSEGLAEYWSEGWDSEAEMIIRDVVFHNTIVPLDQMSRILGTYLMYKEGQAVLKYIAEQYGEEKVLCLMKNVYKETLFSDVLKITVGKGYKELSEEWLYHLKKTRYPIMAVKDLPGMVTTRITNKGFNTMPAFYRKDDIPMVVFMANRDGYSSIYQKALVDYKHETPEIVVKGERTPELESLPLQKSRIDVNRESQLLFIAKSGSKDALFLFSLADKKVICKFKFPELVSMSSPAWSPDGSRIAFSGLDAAGMNDLYLFHVADSSLIRLTNDFYDDRDPAWSPDGLYLVYSSDRSAYGRDGNTNLFLYHIKTSRIQYLTFGRYHDQHPAWSPDGRYIAFTSDRDGVPNIWLIQRGCAENAYGVERSVYSLYEVGPDIVSSPELKQVTYFATGGFNPCWTDSLSLLCTAFDNISFQIRLVSKVLERLKESPVVQPEPLIKGEQVWTFPRIRGSKRSGKVKYKRKFSLDFAQSQVVQDPIFGTSGGGQLGISDLLGDEHYYFLVYNNASAMSEFWDGWNLAATRMDFSRRVNFGIGLYRLAGHYYNQYEGYFYERRYGGFGSVIYPLNKFQRVETSVNIRHSLKYWYGTGRERNALPVSNFISFNHDNSLWGPTGPLDGSRYNIVLGNTMDLSHSNVNFTTVMFDLRKYFRINQRISHAVRILGRFNHGKEPLPFVMGGSWDLRGYRLWSLWGTKLVLISNELRFPFIDQLYFGFPFLGIGFSSIRGALFLDAGNVWDDKFGEIKGSMGFGVRVRIGGYMVLRLDIGKKTNFKEVFPKTFTQFFFGWDF